MGSSPSPTAAITLARPTLPVNGLIQALEREALFACEIRTKVSNRNAAEDSSVSPTTWKLTESRHLVPVLCRVSNAIWKLARHPMRDDKQASVLPLTAPLFLSKPFGPAFG